LQLDVNSEPELPIGIEIELENTKYEGSEVANVVAVQFGPELEDSSLFVSEVVNDTEPGPVDKSLVKSLSKLCAEQEKEGMKTMVAAETQLPLADKGAAKMGRSGTRMCVCGKIVDENNRTSVKRHAVCGESEPEVDATAFFSLFDGGPETKQLDAEPSDPCDADIAAFERNISRRRRNAMCARYFCGPDSDTPADGRREHLKKARGMHASGGLHLVQHYHKLGMVDGGVYECGKMWHDYLERIEDPRYTGY